MTTDPSVHTVAKMLGISVDEVEWTWRRTKYLIQEKNMRPYLAKKQIAKEAKDRPWAQIIHLS